MLDTQESVILEPTADDVLSTQDKQKLFYSYNGMLEWLAFARPAQCNIRAGVLYGVAVWEVVYTNSNGGV